MITTYRVSGCRLSLQGKTRTEIFSGTQTLKGESEFIVQIIESIFWTSLQEQGGALVKQHLTWLLSVS